MKKNNLPALTQTKYIITGQITALSFYNFVLHVFYLASRFAFVILAYMNDRGHILRTFKNAGNSIQVHNAVLELCVLKSAALFSQLGPHVST